MTPSVFEPRKDTQSVIYGQQRAVVHKPRHETIQASRGMSAAAGPSSWIDCEIGGSVPQPRHPVAVMTGMRTSAASV